MGTITIKNLSTLTDKTVVLIVANYWHNAVSMECLSEKKIHSDEKHRRD